uniref:Anoctamin n=1 Tax=Macrostomum lignano TaxID=282301 RepID=A0A1I8IPP1_9PLAT
AEASRLEMPLAQQLDGEGDDAASAASSKVSVSCLKSVAGAPLEDCNQDRDRLYSAPFQKARLELFLNSEDQENFFTPAQRSLLLYEALALLPEFSGCLASGALADCYPMHSEPERENLVRSWATAKHWWRLQPMEPMRRYLGEKIAMYFAWLGFYNKWLVPLAALGCLAFFYGLATVAGDATADE